MCQHLADKITCRWLCSPPDSALSHPFLKWEGSRAPPPLSADPRTGLGGGDARTSPCRNTGSESQLAGNDFSIQCESQSPAAPPSFKVHLLDAGIVRKPRVSETDPTGPQSGRESQKEREEEISARLETGTIIMSKPDYSGTFHMVEQENMDAYLEALGKSRFSV